MLTNSEKHQNKIKRTFERFQTLQVGKCRNEALKEFQKLRRVQCADTSGRCVCISCGKVEHYSKMDGGHYISRRYATAFNPICVQAQCKYCNQHLHGNPAEFRKGLVAKYGEMEVEILEIRKDDPPLSLTKFQLASLRECYKQLTKIEMEKFTNDAN